VSAIDAGRSLGARRTVTTSLALALCTTVLTVGFLTAGGLDFYAWDFRSQYLVGARAIVSGEPLYESPDRPDFRESYPYVYPPLVAVLAVPLTVMSDRAATVVAAAAALAALLAALALLGVRDLRCYAVVVASAPAWNILETANVTALLVLLLAAAWRLRATVWPLAAVLGAAFAAKLLLWPMVAWAALTGRVHVALRALAVAVGLTAGAWATAGFQGVTGYPAIARRLEQVWASDSYSLIGMADSLGVDPWIARTVTVVCGVALLVACRRYARSGFEVGAFTCALAAALVLTPIAWVHYLLFLLVPLAVVRPSFGPIWLVPLAAWLVPRTGNGEGVEPFVPALVAACLVAYILASQRNAPTARAVSR
jgi:hypothetical protein